MILVVDVGNTHTVVGVMEGRRALARWRVSTQAVRTADEYRLLLGAMLDGYAPAGAALASVVPQAVHALREAMTSLVDGPLVVVGPGIRTGMAIRTDNPREVGADRVVNAVGASDRHGAPVVVVDFGTAITVDLVGPGGDYLGGVIAPGIELSAGALVAAAAALRRVPFEPPPRVVGHNTVEAMQSGLVFGFAGLMDGLVERVLAEHGLSEAPVVAAGEAAPVIAEVARTPIILDEDVTVRGLAIIFERNAGLTS